MKDKYVTDSELMAREKKLRSSGLPAAGTFPGPEAGWWERWRAWRRYRKACKRGIRNLIAAGYSPLSPERKLLRQARHAFEVEQPAINFVMSSFHDLD